MQMQLGCDLTGMVALVTGAGGGIHAGLGPNLARALAEAGATVVVSDFSPERTSLTVRDLRDAGYPVEGFAADLTDSAQVDALLERVVDRFGQLDILVNATEVFGSGQRADAISDEEWEKAIAVNLHAAFYLSRAAVRHMRRRRFGRIIHVSNVVASRTSVLNGAAYVATKEALYGLTRHLAIEVGQHGITVNAVLPGFIATPELTAERGEEWIARLAETIPVLRAGIPEDVAAVVVFLASRAAGYISGVAIPIDGAVSVLPGARTDPESAFA